MRRGGWIGLVGVLAATNAAIGAPLPLNEVQNGGFEDGLADWTLIGGGCGTNPVRVVAGGADGTPNALIAENRVTGCFATQALAPTQDDVMLLDFWANVVANAAAPAPNRIEVLANWPQATDFVAVVDLRGNTLQFQVFEGVFAVGPMPAAGAWHHYQAAIVGAGLVGQGLLFVDGALALTATGGPGNAAPPTVMIIGDVTGSDLVNGPAPVVMWDEVYYGPAL